MPSVTRSFHSVLRVFIHSPRGLSRIPHWCLTSQFLAWPTMVVCWPTSVNVKNKVWGGFVLYRDCICTPCLHVNSYRRFEGAHCLRLQGQAVKNEGCSFQPWRRLHFYLSKVSNCLSVIWCNVPEELQLRKHWLEELKMMRINCYWTHSILIRN